MLPRFVPVLLLATVLLASTACGVAFRDSFDGTELFRGIDLAGERVVGSDLTVTLTVNPAYPVPVRIACYYEDSSKLTDDQLKLTFEERATRVGEAVLPPAVGHRPSEKLEPQRLSFHFSVPQPGSYFLACNTPAAADNGLSRSFKITERSSLSPR